MGSRSPGRLSPEKHQYPVPVSFLIFLQQFPGAVRGTVIRHQDMDVLLILCQYGIQLLLYISASVI